MPIARVEKGSRELQPLFTTSGSSDEKIFSRTSSGGSASTIDYSGPHTPAQAVPAPPIDLQSAVDLLQRFGSNAEAAQEKVAKHAPVPLNIPPQQDPLAGPSSGFVVKPNQEPASFHDRPRHRRSRSGSRRTTPVASPTALRHSILLDDDMDALRLEEAMEAGPSSAPPAESPLRSGMPKLSRMASAPHHTTTFGESGMRHPPPKRARSRHSSKAGADHGFGGARLGNLSFSSISLSGLAADFAAGLDAPSQPSYLGPQEDEKDAREVIMTPTTEEYRFFAHHEPDIEEDEGSPDPTDRLSESAVSSDGEDVLSKFRIQNASSHRRNSSFATGGKPGVPRRRGESVRSDDGEQEDEGDDSITSSSIPPEEPVVVPATPSPSRKAFKQNPGLQVVSSNDGFLQESRSSSPNNSPLSRAPSPVSLGHVGPLDPRAYSARSRYRSIQSFEIEEEDAGQGAYGLVKQARERGPSGQAQGPELIIKYIIKQRILADCWKKHKILGPLPVEIHVLDHLRRIPTATFIHNGPKPPSEMTGHPNICPMLDFFEDAEHYYMVMPRFGEGEDLFDYVEAAPDGLPARTMLDVFGQIADAVCFLHSVGIVHRDIKDENVILDGHGRVQLIDFGSAAYVREGRKFDTFSGTLDFAAPEVLRGERYEGREADIWALGVLGYVLLCGECPFWNSEEAMKGLAPNSRSRAALEAKRPSAPEAVDLLLVCLSVDASARPSARDICRHASFNRLAGWRGPYGWRHDDSTPRAAQPI